MTDEEERLRAAIQLIWSIHVRKNVHLGLERFSGLRNNCIPCICALALGIGMDGEASREEFVQQLAAVRHDDPPDPMPAPPSGARRMTNE